MLPSVVQKTDPVLSPSTTCGYVPASHVMDQKEKEHLTVDLLFPPTEAAGGIQIPPQQADWWFPRVQTPTLLGTTYTIQCSREANPLESPTLDEGYGGK